MATVTKNPNSKFAKLAAEMQSVSNVQIKAGFLNSRMAKIARQNNYGGLVQTSQEYKARGEAKGIHVPDYIRIIPRMFMNVAFDRESKNYGKIFSLALKTSKTFSGACNGLGLFIKGNIKDSITQKYQQWARNPDWVEGIKNKENTPLQDSGSMLSSVEYVVEEK